MSDEFKLSVRSFSDVNEWLAAFVARAASDRSIRFGPTRKKPPRAAVVNALLLHVAALPPEAQKAILADGMARLNAYLAGEPQPPAPHTPAPEPAVEVFDPRAGKASGRPRKGNNG